MRKVKINPLVGVFEISLFMKSGFNHFDNDLSKMLRSFLVIIPTLILILLTLPYLQDSKHGWGGDITLGFLSMLYSVKFIFGLCLSLGFAYYFCKVINQGHNFVRFITVINWFSIFTCLLFIPLYLLLRNGLQTYDELHAIFMVISVYSYIILGFVTRHVIDIPWELAVFFTVCFIAINELGFSLLSFVVG